MPKLCYVTINPGFEPLTTRTLSLEGPLLEQISSAWGEWISRDPNAEESGINLYAYAVNNAINRIDLLGLQCCPCDIEKQGKMLIKAYEDIKSQMEVEGIPHNSSGNYSCFNVNIRIYNNLLTVDTPCWKCTMEPRHQGNNWMPLDQITVGWTGSDHWAVVCISKQSQMLFDYWGDRSPGEDPNKWFRLKYDKFGHN